MPKPRLGLGFCFFFFLSKTNYYSCISLGKETRVCVFNLGFFLDPFRVSVMGHFSSVIKSLHLYKSLKLLILLWVFALAQGDVALSPGSDKSTLFEFKSSVSDPYGVLASWNQSSSSDHCSWHGVACDSVSRVVALNISGVGNSGTPCAKFAQYPLYGFGIRRVCWDSNIKLVGKLSPAIAKLSELKVLSLPFNEFDGEMPIEIFGMENLEVLDLEGNSITGSLPARFSGMKKLRVLNLGFNEIVGEIPRSLLDCQGLQVLNLAGNQMNGSIPGFIGGFRDMRGLYLSFNQLDGLIPTEIGDGCGNLEHLELAGNFLFGRIPHSLGSCRDLRSLLLYSNILEEDIPAELGQLNQLQVLDVSRNSLSGVIPSELGSCFNLSILVLSNTWDPFPNSKGSRSSNHIIPVKDEYNFYEGKIPREVTSLPKLRIVWAPRAALQGNFPINWGACDSLEMVNLAHNYFKGEISQGFSSCKSLHFLDLSFNKLTGLLDDKLPVPCMTVFDVSGNLLSGTIPRFSYSTCHRVPSVENYSFQSYDPSSAYELFFARGTQLHTPLPGFGDGDLAVFHNFGGNNFTGAIQSIPIAPERIDEQTIYAFLAGRNKLSGPFPGELFGVCDKLKEMILNITGNSLSGKIPVDIVSKCRTLKVLDVSGNKISGFIPSSFGDLFSLVALNLSSNTLQGPIPGSLGQIKELKSLSLASNNLTGSIPRSFGQLLSLEVLELSSNSLTGLIPKDLVNLRNLSILLLNNNRLSGQIPSGLGNVTTFSSFNASFNNLSGPLPSNNNYDQQDRTRDSRNNTSAPLTSQSQKSGNRGFNSIEIASITSASAIFSVLIALVVLFFYTRKWKPKSRVRGSARKEVTVFTEIGVPLTYENVVQATSGFNASNCIGNGGFGATYKAEVSPGVLLAIKRLAVGRFQGVQQFDAEIKTLGRLRHPNLVTLIGYHASETEMFLIYNYLPGGNLEKFIQERSKRPVDWRILYKIALDIARALAYLHDQCVPRVLHRDVKPSNILLDEDYNAYLSDFGLARLLGTSETHATTGVAGTFGYVAPEYAMTCRVSDKADVYSYGVVLFELISDKKALDPSFSSYGNGFNIVAWACMLLRQGRAKEFFTAGLWDVGPRDDLVEVLHLAVVCTVDSLSTRPTMKQVVRRLKQLQPPSL